MRIIAGSRKGHTIQAPKGLATRPTSDRAREAAFNLIGPVDGATVLDLFAGSGAMGLEALSRDAGSAVFVESDRDACRAIERNLDKLRLRGTVICSDAVRALAAESAARRHYDLVLVDPPYGSFESMQAALATYLPAVLARDGVVVVETEARVEPDLPSLQKRTSRRYGAPSHHTLRARVITAICPGSYDPVTFGHVDVITRAADVFDRVVVGVVGSPHHKKPMFSLDERVGFLHEALDGLENVEVEVFSELVVDFARRWQAKAIVKGLRAISDFEWEFQMNHLNRTLAPEIETVYVMANPQYSYVSSSGVKEIAAFGGKVDELVPESVARRFRELFPDGRPGTPENPTE